MNEEALIINPQNILQHRSNTNSELTTLPYWIRLYLDKKVAGIQSAHTFEAKARDLLGFVKMKLIVKNYPPGTYIAYLRLLII